MNNSDGVAIYTPNLINKTDKKNVGTGIAIGTSPVQALHDPVDQLPPTTPVKDKQLDPGSYASTSTNTPPVKSTHMGTNTTNEVIEPYSFNTPKKQLKGLTIYASIRKTTKKNPGSKDMFDPAKKNPGSKDMFDPESSDDSHASKESESLTVAKYLAVAQSSSPNSMPGM